ncbi:MAG TPA: DNRLRE domain-containing protein [Polyangiaceae bacterium]
MRGLGPSLAVAVAVISACVPPPRMCVSETECGTRAACVAGRCVARGATPAIDSARRLLFPPQDVGWAHRGSSDAADGPPAVATLGRGDGAVLFLRFAVPLPRETTVLEAYLLLDRVPDATTDPAPIALHTARVVSPWDSRSLTWGSQPSVEEVAAPVTRIAGAAGATVRLEVRELVQRWRKRERDDFGIAVIAEGRTATGVTFALAPYDVPADRRDPVLASAAGPRSELEGPRLEAYVR